MCFPIYHLQLEMAAEKFCLAMFTMGDQEEGYRRMRDALLEIDGELDEALRKKGSHSGAESTAAGAKGPCVEAEGAGIGANDTENGPKGVDESCFVEIPLCRAWDLPWEKVPLEDSAGRVSVEFVNLYPPGIPLLAPGERITKEALRGFQEDLRQGLRLQGLCDGGRFVRCVAEEAARPYCARREGPLL